MRSLCSMTNPALCSTSSTAQPVSSRTAWIWSPSRSVFGLVETRGRLVEEQQLGLVDDRPCELDHARDADRQRAGQLLADGGEAAPLEHLARPVRGVPLAAAAGREHDEVGEKAAATAVPLERGEHVVLDRQPAEGLHPLERAPQAPAGAICVADFDVTSLPARTTRPSLGWRTPEMTSKSVVLPAPFGPMMPSTSPALASRLTSLNAAMPPKRTLIPSSERMMSVRAAPPGSPVRVAFDVRGQSPSPSVAIRHAEASPTGMRLSGANGREAGIPPRSERRNAGL